MFGFSQKNSAQITNTIPLIYFHEDHAARSLDESKVGRKGLSIFNLRDYDVPVPAFFVLSPVVYKEILFEAFDTKVVSMLENDQLPEPEELANLIAKTEFDVEFQEELLKNYSRLSGFSDSWVSVRSSVIFPSRPDISFSGIFGTELNVRGFDDLKSSIKEVYSSIFNDKVVYYARTNGIRLSELSMSVVVQKMIQAEVSGVVYTVDPVTMDDKKLSIEAVFGLGDVISNGEITPDQYTVVKKDLSVSEKHIAPQEWMKIRKLSNKRDGKHFGSVERIQISSSWSHQQKLEDRFVQDIAKVALIVEDKVGNPQDLEWVWESGNVWILQSKTIETRKLLQNEEAETDTVEQSPDGLMELAVNIIKSGKIENKAIEDAMRYVQRESGEGEEEMQKKESMVGKDLASRLEEYNSIVSTEEAKVHEYAIKSSAMKSDDKKPVVVKSEEISQDVVEAVNQAYTPLPEPQTAHDVLTKLDHELQKLSAMVSSAKQVSTATNEKVEVQQKIVEQYQEKKVEEMISVENAEEESVTMDLLASGIGVSSGVTIGEVRFMKQHNDMIGMVTKKTVLALNEYSLDMQPYVYQAGGVVAENGGLTSDLAIVCREVGIPAVLGVEDLASKLKDGDIVQIDGNFGSVYKLLRINEVKLDNDEIESKISQLQNEVDEDGQNEESEKGVTKEISEKQHKEKNTNEKLGVYGLTEKEPVTPEKVAADPVFTAKKDLLTDIMSTQVSEQKDTDNVAAKLFTATKVFVSDLGMELGYISKQSDGIFYIDLDRMIVESGVHPLVAVSEGKFADYSKDLIQKLDDIAGTMGSEEVVVSIGNSPLSEFRALPQGKKFENEVLADSTYGAKRYMKNTELLKRVLMIVKKARNVLHNRNISLAIHSPLNGALMSEIKKEIVSNGLRRTSTFNIYAVLDNPAEIIFTQEILNSEIDGVIVNAPALAQNLQSGPRVAKLTGAELGTGNMLKMVNTAIDGAAGLKKKVIVECANSKTLIKNCVSKGVYGVSVSSSVLVEMKHLVADEELKLVLGK